jgi:hypothetical protein
MPYFVYPKAFGEVSEAEYIAWIGQWVKSPLPKSVLLPVAQAAELLGCSVPEILERGQRLPGHGSLWVVEFRPRYAEFASLGSEVDPAAVSSERELYVYPTTVFKRYGRRLIARGEGLRPEANSVTEELRRERERRTMSRIKGWADRPLPKGYPFADEGEE